VQILGLKVILFLGMRRLVVGAELFQGIQEVLNACDLIGHVTVVERFNGLVDPVHQARGDAIVLGDELVDLFKIKKNL